MNHPFYVLSSGDECTLIKKATELIQALDNNKDLFVVYYGGHGRINSERQAEWTCKRDLMSAKVPCSAIQTLFAEANLDVLILLGTCAAASATTGSQHGSMEAVTACGFESKALTLGEHSFTNTLIDLKETKKGRGGAKLERYSKALSIEVCRRNVLPPPSTSATEPEANPPVDTMDLDFDDPCSSPLSSIPAVTPSVRFPHALISLALEESQPDLDVKKTARWLESIPLLAKWAKVEGVYQSYSTLLILSVPVPVWNMLPDNPACLSAGYATSPNIVIPARPFTKLEPIHCCLARHGSTDFGPVPGRQL
ncbi:hypothetical protein V8E51_005355 [Hyaloscypha variabilis]